MSEQENVGTLDETSEAVVPASGIAEVSFGPVPLGYSWEVTRAVVVSDSAVPVRLYRDTVADHTLVSGTSAGAFDEADYSAPIPLRSGQKLIVRWDGATPGDVATANILGRILRPARARPAARRGLPILGGR